MEEKKIVSPVKAIRAFCLDCSGDSAAEVKSCTSQKCPLHAFRFGKNPYKKKREMTEEQRRAAVERLKAIRASKIQ